MEGIVRNIIDGVCEDLGHPVRLIKLLEQQRQFIVPLLPAPKCIALSSIVPWHELGRVKRGWSTLCKTGNLSGWGMRSGRTYGSFIEHRTEYTQLGMCHVEDEWMCDITDVYGFSGSKSALERFACSDQMVEQDSKELVAHITLEQLETNLAHSGIRRSEGAKLAEPFVRFAWDGRLFWMNSDGSHHLAAAKYIAKKLHKPVVLKGRLHTYAINELALASLRRDYEMFIVSDEPMVSCAFHDAMESFKATWLWHALPRPYEDAKALLLPRGETRSMRVAALLRKAGAIDLGSLLSMLAVAQFD